MATSNRNARAQKQVRGTKPAGRAAAGNKKPLRGTGRVAREEKPQRGRGAVQQRPARRGAAQPARQQRQARAEKPQRNQRAQRPQQKVNRKATAAVNAVTTRLLLNVVQSISGEITPAQTHYTVNDVIIPRTLVVAVVGNTLYYRAAVDLGTLAKVVEVKGQVCYVNEDGTKIVVFDQSALALTASGADSDDGDDLDDGDDADDGDDSDDGDDLDDGDDADDGDDSDDGDDDLDGDIDLDDDFEEEAPKRGKGKAAPAKGKRSKPADDDLEEEEFQDDGDDEEEEEFQDDGDDADDGEEEFEFDE